MVNSGGLAKDTQVNSGGLQHVALGGASADAHLYGGVQQLAGTASNTQIDSGAEQHIEAWRRSAAYQPRRRLL
ncbi:FIG00554629: hypothetical protein [Cronobacter muytjensii 530]